jgi:F420-non-reducing hydrogenase iron-sulfur subunit
MEAQDIKIIAFMCWKWGYGAGDMAGTIRAQYPATIRPVRINCTGRVTPSLIMRAIGKGADGVIVAGWYQGECDYETGNIIAAKNVEYTKEILKTAGMSPERVQMFHCSAAEGQKFQQEVTRISDIIKNAGSNPIKPSLETEEKKDLDSKETKKKKVNPNEWVSWEKFSHEMTNHAKAMVSG